MPAVMNWPAAAVVKVWYQAYCDTQSTINEAIYDQAKQLSEWCEHLTDEGIDFGKFLRHPEKGFGLSQIKAQNAVELVEAFKRYPGGNHKSALLWDSLGVQITRLPKIEDSQTRRKVRDRVYRHAEDMNGYVSPSQMTNFIKIADPNYYEEHPSNNVIAKQQMATDAAKMEKRFMIMMHSMKRAIKFLEKEDLNPEYFFTKSSLSLIK